MKKILPILTFLSLFMILSLTSYAEEKFDAQKEYIKLQKDEIDEFERNTDSKGLRRYELDFSNLSEEQKRNLENYKKTAEESIEDYEDKKEEVEKQNKSTDFAFNFVVISAEVIVFLFFSGLFIYSLFVD